MSTYNEEDNVAESDLMHEYDNSFSGDEKVQNLLKLTSSAFTRTFESIQISQIGFTQPVKQGRRNTMTGLTATVRDLGVLTPIHVMKVAEEAEDDDYKYVLLDGLRRIFAALKNGQKEINAVVWNFEDKDKGADLALYITLLLNRQQKRDWQEIWDLYQVLEAQSPITPGTLEYLLQLEPGDAMKLKDVMLSEYDEIKTELISEKKTLEAAYKALAKARKEEDALLKEDNTGVASEVEGAQDLTGDNQVEQLSEEDVKRLLDMADEDIDINDEDFDTLNKGSYDVDHQKVGERHPLDPALKAKVLNRDNFRCKCCGFGGAAALGVLAVHHKIPVHAQGADEEANLVTLCLNHHILLHVAERNGGKLQMTKEEFNNYSEEEQNALRECLKLAKVAVEAAKCKNMSLDAVRKATSNSIKHPMPGTSLSENTKAYNEAKQENKED